MRVLLIGTNREKRPSYAVPAGIAYLQTALQRAGHEAEVLDLCFEPDENLAPLVSERVTAFAPQLIGISIRNVDNETYLQYRANLGDVKLVIDTCRRISSAPLVVGGSAFSLMPKEIMQVLDIDMGVVGEGEPAIVAIADALAVGRPLTDAPGLVRRVGGEFLDAPPARVSDPRSIVAPRSFRPDPRYFSTEVVGPQPTYGIQTKRGCIFRCSYYSVAAVEEKSFRLRDPLEIVDEMRHVRCLAGVNRFFITDSIFNLPRRHATRVCEAMVEADLGVTWMAYSNPLQLDQEQTDLFRRAGCAILNFGLDSGSDTMLNSLSKDFTVADIIRATDAARRSKLRIIHSLLLGGPGESVETVTETLATMAHCQPSVLTIAFGIRLYPQTPLWRTIVEQNGPTDADMLQPLFFVDESLGAAECARILDLIEEFTKQNPDVMVRMNFDPAALKDEVANSSLRISRKTGAHP